MSPLLPNTDLPAAPGASTPPTRIRDAAQQFEALLIGQILRSVRESGGWLGSTDASADSATEYAEQQFAAVLAKRGGLGLADLIARGLEPDPYSR
jgi:peptidoglycan hydrolase FlgJ